MLAGPLIGGAFIDNVTFEEERGTVVIAIDPELLVDLDDFKLASTELIRRVKSSRRKSETQEIRLPGEQARQQYQQSLMSGEVHIDESILEQI